MVVSIVRGTEMAGDHTLKPGKLVVLLKFIAGWSAGARFLAEVGICVFAAVSRPAVGLTEPTRVPVKHMKACKRGAG
jgi:hypothetical protein